MAILSKENCHVDSDSGAVIFHPSSESKAIKEIRSEIGTLNEKMDKILSLLEGQHDREMEE